MGSIQEIIANMKARIESRSDTLATFKGSYQFELTGEGGGTYHLVIDNGAVDLGEGAVENPGCTVTIAASDFQQMVEGKLNPTAAFMSGKLKIKGDMGLAMKLQSIIA